MRKKIVSWILIVALTLSALPMTAFGARALYGDVNGDGRVDLVDALSMTSYLKGETPSGFVKHNADVNTDGKVDSTDLTLLKQYLAEWDIKFGSGEPVVTFFDGDRIIASMQVKQGEPLGEIPTTEETSKADGIFAGWYTDPEFTEPFYAENPVTKDTSVYAKYDAVPGIEETLTIDSFSKQDVGTDYSVIVKGEGDVNGALSLQAKDGSAPPALKVTDNGDGTYTVAADGGFRAGGTYELTLAEGFNFVGEEGELPETVRTAYFTVAKEIVDHLKMNEDIVYIEDTKKIKYNYVDINGDGVYDETADVLTDEVSISNRTRLVGFEKEDYGIDTYEAIICFYTGTDPRERVYTGPNANAYVGEHAVYVLFTGYYGIEPLGEEQMTSLYDIPDVFPIKGKASLNKVNISELDLEVYEQTGLEEPTPDYAKSKIGVGDYVAIYEELKDGDAKSVTFGEITEFDKSTGEIKFKECKAEDITASRDIYVQPAIDMDQVVTDAEKKSIETAMKQQVEESGFAEEAAYALAEMASETDGFKNMEGLRTAMLLGENGQPLSDEEIQMLNLGASFELKEGIKLSVELIDEGEELHYKDGLQLAVNLNADLEVEPEESDGKIVIKLDATFIQEVSLKPTVDGQLTYTELAGVIPVPNGVRVSASIDVLNYTAYDFDVTAYTVAKEDESLWKRVQTLINNPTKLTAAIKDSGLSKKLNKFDMDLTSDIFKGMEDVNKALQEAKKDHKANKEDIEKLQEDLKDLNAIAEHIIEQGLVKGLTVEDWKNSAVTFSKTNIAQELLHLTGEGINFEGDAGVNNDVTIKSVDQLMAKYTEMLEQKTDWITLVEKELCQKALSIKAVNLTMKLEFVLRTDLSIAMGSTLEYETGKRYNFWFKFGLYAPTSGSSQIDLIDESMVFQFYVMGKLCVKMGLQLTLGANIGCDDFVHVGIYGEVGPYVKLYGFFIYTYERFREAGLLTPVVKEQKMGALYLETGVYLILGAEAGGLKDLFEVSYDFLDKEFPILKAGKDEYPYAFSTEFEEDEKVIVRDQDGNSSTGVSMVLPKQIAAMDTMKLTTGKVKSQIFDYSNYNVYLSNPNFSFNKETGEITVKPKEGVRFMDCEMKLTFKHGKMAFSDYDIELSVPLYWTNLSTDEQKECYNASVRVGNDLDGYETVWTKRVMKREPFTLPTDEKVRELIGYDDTKYTSGGYAESYDTSSGIIEDAVYDYTVEHKTYDLTVTGIQGGSATSQTFTAKYGQAFDFSALEGTGKNDAKKGEYTTFYNVTSTSKIKVGTDAKNKAIYEVIDLRNPISGKVAEALAAGKVKAKANYVDDSVKAFFEFSGPVRPEDTEQTLRKGDTVDISAFELEIAEQNKAIIGITPDIAPLYQSTTYFVTSGELTGDSYTLSFEENGGNAVEDITKIGGSIIGALPTPEREGYTFAGWFADEACETPFESKFLPKENTTVYAKWDAKSYTVSFHINGGTSETPEDMKVVFGQPYGELPEAERKGHGLVGWFTAAEGGTQVTADSIVDVADNQTLYAQWVDLEDIPRDIFSFTKPEDRVYHKDKTHGDAIQMSFTPEDGATYKQDEFIVEYLVEGDAYENGYVTDPKNAGTYLARITRPGDDRYSKFEETYEGVLTIQQAGIEAPADGFEIAYQGHSAGEHATQNPASFDIVDMVVVGIPAEDKAILDDCEKFEYQMRWTVTDSYGKEFINSIESHDGFFTDVLGREMEIWLCVDGDQNYKNMEVRGYVMYDGQRYDNIHPRDRSYTWESEWTEEWRDGWGFDNMNIEVYTVEQLAQLAYWCQSQYIYDGFHGNTITLMADLDLNERVWTPIGTEDKPFHGTFDGNGHTITNLYGDEGGLFGVIGEGATIKNLTVKDSVIYDGWDAGAIANVSHYDTRGFGGEIKIENCTVDNVLFLSKNTGGILSRAKYGHLEIADCSVTDKTDFSRTDDRTGGIVAEIGDGSKVTNCVNHADLGMDKYPKRKRGGIVGVAERVTITNCINNGNLVGDNAIGGITGTSAQTTIIGCTNNGTVEGDSKVGGITGEGSANTKITDCIVNGNVIGKTNVGEIWGATVNYDGTGPTVENSVFNGTLTIKETK